jgi:hypothetical protein
MDECNAKLEYNAYMGKALLLPSTQVLNKRGIMVYLSK